MTRNVICVLLALAPLFAFSQASTPDMLAINHVSLIDMTSDRIKPDMTVLIRDGRIVEVGKDNDIKIPTGTHVISGKGKFLIPGMADMHVHVRYKEDLIPYLANGITTVLYLGGPRTVLAIRDSVATGKWLGPAILAAAIVDGVYTWGWEIHDKNDAEKAIVEIKDQHWDFIKVYNNIPKDAYITLMAGARKLNIPVVGHGVRALTLEEMFNSGQSMIAHGEEFIYNYFRSDRSDTLITAAVNLTKKYGVTVTPNLSTFEAITKQWGKPAELDKMMANPEIQYVSGNWKAQWKENRNYIDRTGSLDANYAFLKKMTKRFSDAGIPLLAGTDTPTIPGQPTGFAIHDDLRVLVECGLTPYQALETATKNPGEFVVKSIPGIIPFGKILRGYKADLVLLNDNPLLNISHLRNRAGVVANGKWFSEEALAAEMKLIRNE